MLIARYISSQTTSSDQLIHVTAYSDRLSVNLMMKHSYDEEFKEQAVQYYLDNKDHMTMNEISKNLGIGASTLHKWIKLFTETREFGRGIGQKSLYLNSLFY
jgi:transposase